MFVAISVCFVAFLLSSWFVVYRFDKPELFMEVTASLAALVTLLIVLFTSIGAVDAYRAVQRATVDRTTFELIQRYVHDEDVIELVDKFRSVRISEIGDNLGDYDDNKVITFDKLHGEYIEAVSTHQIGDKATKDTPYEIVMRLLNSYEAVAIGIRNGAISESMLFQWWKPTYVLDFIDLMVFVKQYRMRKGQQEFAETAEDYAFQWANDDEQRLLAERSELADRLEARSVRSQMLYRQSTSWRQRRRIAANG
ncbi:MAG: hypothetical protein AAFR65_04480 [Pseudomonadota bacterium]